MMVLYVSVFGGLVIWKYTTFGYTGLDLAIFNQTMWASVHGHPLAASIHEPSYLGDHASPALLLLAPAYAVWPSPVTLLLLQVLAIALTTLPLYAIGRRWLSHQPWLALIPPLMYLLNPFVHYATLFEFEFFIFAAPLMLGAVWAWQTNRWRLFLLLFILALLVREDVALVGIALAGIIWWTNRTVKQPNRWWITPLLLSITWAIASWFITAHFTPTGQYKFLIYYRWLGSDLGSIITAALTQPWRVAMMLFRWRNIELVILMLMPWCFIPLRAPRWFWIGIPSLLLYTLSSNGANLIILQTHYGTFINASLALATAAAIASITAHPPKWWHLPTPLLVGLLLIAPIYLIVALNVNSGTAVNMERQLAYRQALSSIPTDAAVVASNSLITQLSSREHVFALTYVFLGQKQFSSLPYSLPAIANYAVTDGLDVVLDHWRYSNSSSYQNVYPSAAERLRQQLQPLGVVGIFDTVLVWQRGNTTPPPYTVTTTKPQNLFLCQPVPDAFNPATQFSCSIQFQTTPNSDYQLAYMATKNGTTINNRLLPLAYGFYRTSQLLPDQRLTVIYDLINNSISPDQVCVELWAITGKSTLNYFASVVPRITFQHTITSSCWTISQ